MKLNPIPSTLNPKIIFMGTPEFGTIILEGLINGGYKPILVVTAPDKPVGRKQILTPPPAKISAQRHNIPVLQPEILANSKLQITNYNPDLIVVAAYGKILPKEILEISKYGCLAVHPSLLPQYRGPSPIQTAILNGDEKTGATIYLMDEKIDHGPILAKREWEFSISNFQFSKLHDKLAELGAELLIKTIPKWIEGEIKPKPQDESKTTYTKIFKKEDGKIDWKKSAKEIEKQIRAFEIWPNSWTLWQSLKDTYLRIKISKADVFKSPRKETYPLGKVLVVPQNEIGIQCGKDFLRIKKLKLEGKKEITSEEFLRGHPDFIGTILK